MSNKNPFEIRTEVLALAKDYMDKQYAANLEFTKSLIAQGQKTVEEAQASMQMYTTEELMKKATEMYSFVSKKD
jgi:hypothetical protein